MDRSYATVRVERNMSICPPACRTLLIEVWRITGTPMDKPEFSVEIHPVLAIGVRVFEEWQKRYMVPREKMPIEDLPATIRQRENLGWRYQGRFQESGVMYAPSVEGIPHIVWDGDTDLDMIGSPDRKSCVIAAPWPQDMDEEKLSDAIKRLRDSLSQKTAAESRP